MRYWLVMPAAGVGRRFGTTRPKQYAPLRGRAVIEWALAPFLADPACVGTVVVLAADDPYWNEVASRLATERLARESPAGATERLARESPAGTKLPEGTPELILASGGAERSHTVRNGLAAIKARATTDDWVLVHDAARPCLSSTDLQQLFERLRSHPVGGLLATPAADTLKRAGGAPGLSGHPEIDQTVDRAGLWRALTPQMFRYNALCDALDRAHASGRVPTDEAQALEWAGQHPVLVQGSAANIKITSADDLLVAAALLGARDGTS